MRARFPLRTYLLLTGLIYKRYRNNAQFQLLLMLSLPRSTMHSWTVFHKAMVNLHVILSRNTVLVNPFVTTETKVIESHLSALIVLSQNDTLSRRAVSSPK